MSNPNGFGEFNGMVHLEGTPTAFTVWVGNRYVRATWTPTGLVYKDVTCLEITPDGRSPVYKADGSLPDPVYQVNQ